MMNKLLQLLLAAADDVGRKFDYATVSAWPPGALETFQRLGILRRSAGDPHAPCPNCHDGHVESVTVRTCPDGIRRFYISCPESLRVEVSPEMCECWEIDPDGFVAAVARLMRLKVIPKPVVSGRFWRLGRVPWPPGSSQARMVVLTMRMQDDDAPAIAAHVGAGGRAIVLVPHHIPDPQIWLDRAPAVIPLADVMIWDNGQTALDVMAMVDVVETADQLASQATAITLNANGKRVLRQQVKAEMKGQLEDDVLVAAYKMHGSVRKAAEALTKQLERPITKDKVQGAVTRAGGAKAVFAEMDSTSVSRIVASQRRDRAKKIMERR